MLENTKALAKQFNTDLQRSMERWKNMQFCPVCDMPLITSPCDNCKEVAEAKAQEEKRQREKDIKRLGGMRPYVEYTREKLDGKYYDLARTMEMVDKAKNLYLWGDRGIGKTHIATVVVRKHPEGLILGPQHILRAIKEKALEAKKEQEQIDYFVAHPMLCIDDLGSEKLTPHTRSLLYEIIDGRWSAMSSGLVITSNLSPEDLSVHLEDDRIVSRIVGLCKIIRLSGIDRRIGKGE